MKLKMQAKSEALLPGWYNLLVKIQENHILLLGIGFSFIFHTEIPFDLDVSVFWPFQSLASNGFNFLKPYFLLLFEID